MNPWLLGIGLLSSLFGRQEAASEASRARSLEERQLALIEPYTRRQFKRREEIFEPVEEEALGRLTQRMRTSPWYAGTWLGQARGLRAPMRLAY